MDFFYEIKQRIQDFARNNPRVTIISSVIAVLFFAALIIVLIQTSPAKKKYSDSGRDFPLDFSVMPPDEPELEKDYYFSRESALQWNDEQIKQWFTLPEPDSTKDLELSNDEIISEITGAAP